jgi:hypothetical protein
LLFESAYNFRLPFHKPLLPLMTALTETVQYTGYVLSLCLCIRYSLEGQGPVSAMDSVGFSSNVIILHIAGSGLLQECFSYFRTNTVGFGERF